MSFERELVKLHVKYDIPISSGWIGESKLDEFQMVTQALYAEGELACDYSKECRLRVVQGRDIEQFNVQQFRQYFLRAYSGQSYYADTKALVEQRLREYMATHPEHSYELICRAAKQYVDHCTSTGEWMSKCSNFIRNDKGESKLEVVAEELSMSPGQGQGTPSMTDLI